MPVRRQRERPQGRILLDGKRVAFAHPAEACRAGVALVTEDRKRLGLFAEMTVGENITLCTLDSACARACSAAGRGTSKRRAIVAATGREDRRHRRRRITSLSGGNQQKAIIGRWLLTEPKVLLLDDPTRGIDVGAKAELYRLMDDCAAKGWALSSPPANCPSC